MAKHSVHGQSDDTGVGDGEVTASRNISRRTLAKGAAWSVPAIMLATAAPAYAGSVDEPTNLGPLLESSATISDQAVVMASMFIAKSTGVTPDDLKGVLFDITLTITCDATDTSSEFHTAGGLSKATLTDTLWSIDTQDVKYIIIKMHRTVPYESTGFAGFSVNYNTGTKSDGDWNGPPTGSITVTAEGTGWRSDGTKAFTIDGVIMGEGDNTTTPRTPEVPIIGPYFACGGTGSEQVCGS